MCKISLSLDWSTLVSYSRFKDSMLPWMTKRSLRMQRNQFSRPLKSFSTLKITQGTTTFARFGWYKCKMMCHQSFWIYAQFCTQLLASQFSAHLHHSLCTIYSMLQVGCGHIHVLHVGVNYDEMNLQIHIRIKCGGSQVRHDIQFMSNNKSNPHS